MESSLVTLGETRWYNVDPQNIFDAITVLATSNGQQRYLIADESQVKLNGKPLDLDLAQAYEAIAIVKTVAFFLDLRHSPRSPDVDVPYN